MKSLEDLLRDKANSGDLNHISIAFLHSGGWSVSYRGAMQNDYRNTDNEDVVNALIEALTGRKPPPVAKPPKPARKRETAPTAAPIAKPAYDPLGDLM